jgi:glyoxylase-like metal-dependent hydrolase (beta-lactamase superfamily II)
MRLVISAAMAAVLLLASPQTRAAGLEVQKVADNVFALVGELDQRSAANLGNNATFGAVVTKAGTVLIDPGGSKTGAQQIETALRSVTDQPVVAVINTGGQDHRWLGNHHFKSKGARLIASARAVADQKARADMQVQGAGTLIGQGFTGTVPLHADDTFDAKKEIIIGGTRFVLIPGGGAHTPGDAIIWLPAQRIAFTGDIVYVERMLGVIEVSRTKDWLATFGLLEALDPLHVVPGHGHATDLAAARRDTRDYLTFLRREVRRVLDGGGTLETATTIDQSSFAHLKVADQISRRNAMQVFVEMEFE